MNIVVLAGGISPERNVSLSTGLGIAKALAERGHTVRIADPALGRNCFLTPEQVQERKEQEVSSEELASYSPASVLDCLMALDPAGLDIVMIALHGKYGEDGTVQAVLEMRGIPYTGTGSVASVIAMDKHVSKSLFEGVGVLTASWIPVSGEVAADEEMLIELRDHFAEEGMVIKPNDQGSTVGVTIVTNGDLEAIANGIRHAAEFSRTVIVESYIAGREITVGILDGEVLPIVEIVPNEGFYDYKHKYTGGHTTYLCPAPIDPELAEYIQELALRAHQSLGCEVYSRVDFRLDGEGKPFCLEVNTLPGMTSSSLLPKAAAAHGIEYGDVCERIVEASLRRWKR